MWNSYCCVESARDVIRHAHSLHTCSLTEQIHSSTVDWTDTGATLCNAWLRNYLLAASVTDILALLQIKTRILHNFYWLLLPEQFHHKKQRSDKSQYCRCRILRPIVVSTDETLFRGANNLLANKHNHVTSSGGNWTIKYLHCHHRDQNASERVAEDWRIGICTKTCNIIPVG